MSAPNFSSSRDFTLYTDIQTTDIRTVNNASGTWTNTNAKKQRFDSLTMSPTTPTVDAVNYKTGSPSPLLGSLGRVNTSLSIDMPLIPSGAAGTVPDCDHILQSVTGVAPTIVASTSVTYNLSSGQKYLTILSYDKSSGLSAPTNLYGFGFIPASWKIDYNGTELKMSISGNPVCTADSDNFSTNYTGNYAAAKGALTTFPAEPSGLTTNGQLIPAFAGVATFDSIVASDLVSTFTIQGNLGIEPIADAYGDPFIIGTVRGLRTFSGNFTFQNSDSTSLKNLKKRAFTKVPITITVVLGTVAGQVITATLNNVQMAPQNWSENGAKVNVAFDNNMCHETTAGSQDDFQIMFS